MKSFLFPSARDDILRYYRYLLVNENSPKTAERFLRTIQVEIKQLCRRPKIGAPVILKNPQLAGLRSWLVQGFPSIRIYYLLSPDGIRIIRVLHGKRDTNSILEQESLEQ